MLRKNRRVIWAVLLAFCFTFTGAAPLKAASVETTAKSALLIEANTGRVLFEKNPWEKLPMASVTKLMTLVVAAEAVANGKAALEDVVTASKEACSLGGSQIYLEPGEKFSLREMMIAIAVGSANDACVAVAEHLYGTHEAFVEKMNEKAAVLGMHNTHYVNAYGLPAEEHYTTAEDLGLLSREALRYPLVMELTKMKEYDLRGGKFKLWNTNKLLWWYDGADGLKTGWTQEAKYCLASTVQRGDLRLISVVLGVPEANGHFDESMKLFNYGFANFMYKEFAEAGSKQGEAEVSKGVLKKVDLITEGAVGVCVPKEGETDCWMETALPDQIQAPVQKGQILGTLVIKNAQGELANFPLAADADVPKAGFFHTLGSVLKESLIF